MKISSWYNYINSVKLVLFLFLISLDRKNNIKHQGKVANIIIIFLNYNKIICFCKDNQFVKILPDCLK